MKEWILKNLMTIDKRLCSKKCNKLWFEKNNHLKEYDSIISYTNFLNVNNPNLPFGIVEVLNMN